MNSTLLKPRPDLPPLRESLLVVTVINHPAIGFAAFDEFAELELDHPMLRRLQSLLLQAFADAGDKGVQPGLDDINQHLEANGAIDDAALLQKQIRENRVWQAGVQAAFEDARDGWFQALALHQRTRGLKAELRIAERSFAELGDESSFDRLTSIQQELASDEGMDALIEGFGLSSGRPMRNF